MAVYLMIVYAIAAPFGAAAQAGFGIGMRIVQAMFMPVVALGFAVAPVAGQNFGARLRRARARGLQDGVHDGGGRHVRRGASSATSRRPRWCGFFSNDPAVVAVGDEYLRIISLELRRVGIDLRHVEHVPGDGQHHSVADGVGVSRIVFIAIPAARALAAAGLRAALDLVPVGCGDPGAAQDHPAAAAARAPPAPCVRPASRDRQLIGGTGLRFRRNRHYRHAARRCLARSLILLAVVVQRHLVANQHRSQRVVARRARTSTSPVMLNLVVHADVAARDVHRQVSSGNRQSTMTTSAGPYRRASCRADECAALCRYRGQRRQDTYRYISAAAITVRTIRR